MVLNQAEKPTAQRKLSIGDHTTVQGIVLMYEKARNELRPVVMLGKATRVEGQLYSGGLLNYKDGVVINGSMTAERFLYQTDYTRYENYLINIRLDAPALSRYYLTSGLLPATTNSKRVLQWLK